MYNNVANGNSQFEQFKRVLDVLAKHKVDYILVGGVAVILHGIERLTRDIDIFVKMEHRNIERLRNALHSIFNLKKDTIRHKDRFDAAYLLDLIKTREADAAPKKTK